MSELTGGPRISGCDWRYGAFCNILAMERQLVVPQTPPSVGALRSSKFST